MHPMMFVHYVEKRCEVNDKYYVLSVPGIKEKNPDLENVNWLWLLYTRGYVMLTGRYLQYLDVQVKFCQTNLT